MAPAPDRDYPRSTGALELGSNDLLLTVSQQQAADLLRIRQQARQCIETGVNGPGIRLGATEALQHLVRDFEASPPRLVIVDTLDREFTPLATDFLRWIEEHASWETRIGAIRIFESKNAGERRANEECGQTGRVAVD